MIIVVVVLILLAAFSLTVGIVSAAIGLAVASVLAVLFGGMLVLAEHVMGL